jgi:hypothetical protein
MGAGGASTRGKGGSRPKEGSNERAALKDGGRADDGSGTGGTGGTGPKPAKGAGGKDRGERALDGGRLVLGEYVGADTDGMCGS